MLGPMCVFVYVWLIGNWRTSNSKTTYTTQSIQESFLKGLFSIHLSIKKNLFSRELIPCEM